MDDVRGRFLGLPHGTTPAAVTTNKNMKMSSFKSSENIQKKEEGGPDRSVSDNQSSSVTLNELAMKARKILKFQNYEKIFILLLFFFLHWRLSLFVFSLTNSIQYVYLLYIIDIYSEWCSNFGS